MDNRKFHRGNSLTILFEFFFPSHDRRLSFQPLPLKCIPCCFSFGMSKVMIRSQEAVFEVVQELRNHKLLPIVNI